MNIQLDEKQYREKKESKISVKKKEKSENYHKCTENEYKKNSHSCIIAW